MEPPPSRLIALSAPSSSIVSASSVSESPPPTFDRLPSQATATSDSLETPWDYFHCPPGTRHVLVGAGDGPCVVLMIGARRQQEAFGYPVSEVAARHGASVSKETSDPDEAYAGRPDEFEPVRLPWPPNVSRA